MAEYDSENSDMQVGPAREDLSDLWEGLRRAWAGRNQEYSASRAVYFGEHWNNEDNPPPKNRYSITANYTESVADKDVQILMGVLPGLQVMPPGADEGARAFAERLEGLLYGNYEYNEAHKVFLKVAWNSVVVRRGLIYYYWDPKKQHVCWKSCSPDNFYPVYDGEEVVEAIYVSRRLTRSLKADYPHLRDQITSDDGIDFVWDTSGEWAQVSGGVTDAMGDAGSMTSGPAGGRDMMLGYTTVLDYYNNEGEWVRMMGNAEHRQRLGYPVKEVPFIEFPNTVQGDEHEPRNSIDKISELNLYLDQLLSQRADVIKKWSNPPIIDAGSGVDPAKIKTTLGGDGGIIPINRNGDIRMLLWQGTMPEISEQITEVKDTMYDLSGKPRSAYGQTVTNQSGVMTNLALTPTLQSNELRETLWGAAMVTLNKRILQLYEEFASNRDIAFKGVRAGKTPKSSRFFEVSIKGKEIEGWYESRIKWPSAVRTDDPAFVQMELSKLQSKPQAQSIYDTLENLGVEDVESHIDRIRAEHEDPRIHPEILQQTIDSLTTLGQSVMPPDMEAAGAALAGVQGSEGTSEADYNQGMIASGMPQPAEV